MQMERVRTGTIVFAMLISGAAAAQTPPDAPPAEAVPPPPPVEAAPPAEDRQEARPKAEPRLREAQPRPSSPVPKTPTRQSDSITTTIVKSAARTATNIAVREASKAIFGSGRNAGVLGQILRGTLGGLVK